MRRDKNNKPTQAILVAFIAFIMLTSVIGFIWSGNQKISYNGFTFEQSGNGYITEIDKKTTFFNFLPMDVEDIKIDNNIIAILSGTLEIDATSDFNDTNKETIALVQYNLDQVLRESSNIYLRQGLTTNNTFNLPIITCNNTKEVPVVYFKTATQTMVSSEDNCVIIGARSAIDLVRVKDKLLYSILGVIE